MSDLSSGQNRPIAQMEPWFDEAEKELVSIINAFPADKKAAQDQLEKLKKERAELFVESIERAANVGQPLEAIEAKMERDTYLTAIEAKEFGLVDEVVESRPSAMSDSSAG